MAISLPVPGVASGTAAAALLNELGGYVVGDPFPFAVDLAACEGMYLATMDGQKLHDWVGYYGSKWIAHNHPRLFEPEYVRRLVLAANNKVANVDFVTPECVAYYRALHDIAPRCMRGPALEIYTLNSGAEAVENMMKYFIKLHGRHPRRPSRRGALPGARRFIYFEQAFHGRTVFALHVTELTHSPVITRGFHGFVHGNLQVPFPAVDTDRAPGVARRRTVRALRRVERILRAHDGEVAGIIVEPIQGAGGHRTAEPEFFQGLSRLAHRFGVSLGFDEVQTAGGQTGAMFMVDQLDLPYPPQAVACGKKLGNGVIYMLEPMEDRGVLDSTWGGTLADMVRFVQELRIVRDERLIEQVPAKGVLLATRLGELRRQFPGLMRNVRGVGLHLGFSLRSTALRDALLDAALAREALLLLGAGPDSVRLRPHLHVAVDDIESLAAKLHRLLASLS